MISHCRFRHVSLKRFVRTTSSPGNRHLWDLITILGDNDDSYRAIDFIDNTHLAAMARNWQPDAKEEELRSRIIELRLIYDWPALKSMVRICPGSATDKFRLNDLFNLLDMHLPGFGVRAPAYHENANNRRIEQFFDARRLIGAKKALLMILIALFYIDYQVCISSNRGLLQKYMEFSEELARRMQRQGEDIACRCDKLDEPSFYQADVSFISLNYDPIALWAQFVANRKLNSGTEMIRVEASGGAASRLS